MPGQKDKKIILGLSGAFGSGKSTVAGMFRSLGIEVIDADKIAHSLIRPGTRVYKKVISAFGRGILKKSGKIERGKLGKIVFADKKALIRLNSIIHPQVIKIMGQRIKIARAKIIVLDAPLLIEAGLKDAVDKLIIVRISRQMQIKRIRAKMHLSRSQILKRIRCQLPLGAKLRLADFIIDNNGRLDETRRQVERVWRELTGLIF
jgi:dephospho-CoA kinase